MASKLSVSFLLLLFLSVLSRLAVASTPEEKGLHGLGLAIMIPRALSNKGYVAMSLILEQTLPSLMPSELSHNNNTTTNLTIFCPTDIAFFSLKYPQPPFTLLQYHIVPTKLDREALESSLQFESKLNTLFGGHPLVVTTLPKSQFASINKVKITDWEIDNDGHVIVHGIEDFFDPALQILQYPWYDNGGIAMNEEKISTTTTDEEGVVYYWVKRSILEKIFIMIIGVYDFRLCIFLFITLVGELH